MDNVLKETHVVSVMINWYKETCTVVRDEKDDRLLPHQIRRSRLTKGENIWQWRGKLFRPKEQDSMPLKKTVETRHVKFGILPCVNTTSLGPAS